MFVMPTVETQLLVNEETTELLQRLYPEPGVTGMLGVFVCLEMAEG